MGREIKFRAFDKRMNKMIDTGFHVIGESTMFGMIDLHIEENKFDMLFLDRLNDIIVSQYIGLSDKNGKAIYEGDYLVDYYQLDDIMDKSFLPVVWDAKTLMWCVDVSFAKDGSFLTSLVKYFGEHLEVEGNIYENKEL